MWGYPVLLFGFLFGGVVLGCCFGVTCPALHLVLPSYKSYEAQAGLSEMGTRPGARDATS